MKSLKRLFLSKTGIRGLLAGIALAAPALAEPEFVLTKTLRSPGGVGLHGGPFEVNFSWGEAAAGYALAVSSVALESGYYGGRFGAGQRFKVLQVRVGGSPAYFQNGLQIGVTIQAPIQIEFSDPLDPASIAEGIRAAVLQDHLAARRSDPAEVKWSYDPTGRTLWIMPVGSWKGNTVYDIAAIPGLRSVSGYALDAPTHVQFLTMADPHQENIITNALGAPGGAAPPAAGPTLRVQMQAGALPDYAVVLFNTDPLQHPWRVDPGVIQDAAAKARQAGGDYQTPIGYLEIAAYNPEGQLLQALAHPAVITMTYDAAQGVNPPAGLVRSSALALWALDQEHRLWVKIPGSHPSGQGVSAPITRLSVFALMGSASGIARDVFVFPIPWRPYGPKAGDGPGQSGTEAGGLTFNNLPSECDIRIYTLSGELIRDLRHSDVTGPIAQEKWDGMTRQGEPAASGVYLWRVESESDGKNGKLMIIR